MDFNFTSDNESEATGDFSLDDSRELIAELQLRNAGHVAVRSLRIRLAGCGQILDLHEQNG